MKGKGGTEKTEIDTVMGSLAPSSGNFEHQHYSAL